MTIIWSFGVLKKQQVCFDYFLYSRTLTYDSIQTDGETESL